MTTMRRRFWRKEDAPEYIAGQSYTNHQIDLMADAMLKADSKREMCRICGGQGVETGEKQIGPQFMYDEDGEVIGPLVDGEGRQLAVVFHELACPEGHLWMEGEGKAKGFKGDNPVLLEEHLIARKRREIFCENGTPDPNIVAGSYNKTHPEGRRVNSDESRRVHGAAFYSAWTLMPLLLLFAHLHTIL
jgi:hypothetical protein